MEMEENSDSEEEILVYAEFDDSVNIEQYRSIHVLGIGGKNPIIQADDTFFTGKIVNPLGTYMFFEEDPTPKHDDNVFHQLSEKNLKYLSKTNKLLNMEHAYAMPRAEGEQVLKNEIENEGHNEEIQTVKFTSVEEAIEKFKSVLIPTVGDLKSGQEPLNPEFRKMHKIEPTYISNENLNQTAHEFYNLKYLPSSK